MTNSAYEFTGVEGMVVVEYDAIDKVSYYRSEPLSEADKETMLREKKEDNPATPSDEADGPPRAIDACR